jgi:hypothetical protein
VTFEVIHTTWDGLLLTGRVAWFRLVWGCHIVGSKDTCAAASVVAADPLLYLHLAAEAHCILM